MLVHLERSGMSGVFTWAVSGLSDHVRPRRASSTPLLHEAGRLAQERVRSMKPAML